MRTIDAATLRGWITDHRELALLDAREEGEFGLGHPFWAAPCPLSRREIRARRLLPRLGVRTVCIDDGRGLAGRLAQWLESIGAADVAILEGGVEAWAAAGWLLFSGVNVPSRAFATWVERRYATETVSAAQVKSWLDAAADVAVLDARTFDEFHRRTIPRSLNVPGEELVWRIADLVPDPATTVVVTSAGRTRAILGAESLRRAGVPNRVLALADGTMGWELAGYALEPGRGAHPAAAPPATAALALKRAKAFAEAAGVGVIGPLDLSRFESDPGRTCYVLDVRDTAAFAAGHRPGSLSAPGGQLVRATDDWIGVRNARVALVDDDGVRARTTAAWLRQMGHRNVFVVEGGLDEETVPGRAPLGVPELRAPAATITQEALAAALATPSGATVIDFNRSIGFRDGHIPGALWAIRTRLDPIVANLAAAPLVVLTSPDGVLARLALPEVTALTAAPVRLLEGGTAAWARAGHPLARGRADPPDEACIDFHLRPYDRNSGIEAAIRDYLAWEAGLLDGIERDGTVAFALADPA